MTQRAGGRGGTERARIRDAVAPVVHAAGYDLEDVTVSRAGRRSVVKVTVDVDGGVTLDGVAELSREISAVLDDAERAGDVNFGGRPYTLEVSSPGVDRPLTEPRHWRRNVGRLVQVRVDGRVVCGRIRAADDAEVHLDLVSGARNVATGETVVFAYEQLGAGRVQVEFGSVDHDDTSNAAAARVGKEEA